MTAQMNENVDDLVLEKHERLYEGKAKIFYATKDPEKVIQYFKDDATAFNALKKGTIVNKGIMNNKISSHIFKYLAKNGVSNHYLNQLSDREMLVRKLEIFPLEVVMRNVIAGSLSKKTGRPEGEVLPKPLLEFYYKDDDLGDPMISRNHALVFGWANEAQMDVIEEQAYLVNKLLVEFFLGIGIQLIDFKLEFGQDRQGNIFLADEVTPDGCRLWDVKTQEKLDKDRFRRDLGKIEESYERVLHSVLQVAI